MGLEEIAQVLYFVKLKEMNKCFINGVGCVSAQQTTEEGFLINPIDYLESNMIDVVKPEYKAFIPPAAIRRMSSSVKNSVVASQLAINEAGIKDVAAIITGTGLGCIGDSEKFLNKLIDDNEEYLTPTSFIQSTHNTVAGQIALGLQCKSYNLTYVNGGASFPSALLDGLMKIQEGEIGVLVGGMDELSSVTNQLYQKVHHYKQKDEIHGNILHERSKGCVPSEGAAFFVLENEKKENSYAELIDVTYVNELDKGGVSTFLNSFLKQNNVEMNDLDLIVLGNNGDVDYDTFYDEVESLTPSISKVYFKHVFGEFMTSNAIGLWVASNILKTNSIPEVLLKDKTQNSPKELKRILFYNQYRGKDHSLILLQNV